MRSSEGAIHGEFGPATGYWALQRHRLPLVAGRCHTDRAPELARLRCRQRNGPIRVAAHVSDPGWPRHFPADADDHVREGVRVISRSGAIEGRTTGSRRPCASQQCDGWFHTVRWETGQLLHMCSKGWQYDSARSEVRVTGGGEISARVVSPEPAGVPPQSRDQWPPRATLARWKGWRVASP